MPIYNAYSDNDYDDDDYYDDGQCNDTYDTTITKSPPSPMLVLKGDRSLIDIDGDPYDSNFKNDDDEFCEQYLNDTSTSFEDERAFFRTELK